MKIAVTADIHLTNFSQDPIDKNSSLPERLAGLNRSLRYMCDYCRKKKIENIIIAGDLFHNKGVIYVDSLNVFLDIVYDYKDLYFTIISGNHDLTSKSEDGKSSIRSVEHVENINYMKKSGIIGNIYYVPYNPNMVNQIKNCKEDILISHFGLNEGVLNSGISVVADIAAKDLFGKYKLVILGHYHKAQQLINDDISIYYCGSPIQLDWGEANEEKRFLVVDSKTLEVESVPFEGYSKFFKMEVKEENQDTINKEIKKLIKEGHKVKAIKTEEFEYTPPNGTIVVDKTEKDITNRGVTSTMSREEQIIKYLEIKKIPPDQFELYKSVALEIIQDSGGMNA